MMKKKTKGRQKIEIKKITRENDRMTTFSKRRSGIYKKINELSTLCGAEIAFLVFSAAGNPFTFGSPSFESVSKRFFGNENRLQTRQNNNNASLPLDISLIHAPKNTRLDELSRRYCDLIDNLDAEKERMKALTPLMNRGRKMETVEEEWWRTEPTEIKDEEVLVRLIMKFEELYENLSGLLEQRSRTCSSSHLHGR
ncbi:PREDICTED: agamous-like MADS-box protein AGL62 [Tarenaya hassleriana]|uniref:agamous-like MADS-box protein AGL62 n=1 Tax=Tarenaya hassleriana TaxID=28532 RepID=UPI00053C76AD|nr:PREDICTED: agamous-like MADS-box protein AGL62 [Tarenaya hassleriana]